MIIRLQTWAKRGVRRESGVALIIVLMVIVAFALLVAGMTTSLEVETRLARNFTRDRTLEWHCYSGMELARYLLAQQIKVSIANKQFDALNQRWAGGPMGYDEPFNFINTTNTAFGDSPTNNTVLDLIYPPEDRGEWEEENEVMIITQQGKVLRTQAQEIRPIGRATQGVRLIEIDAEDSVVSIARLVEREGDNTFTEN